MLNLPPHIDGAKTKRISVSQSAAPDIQWVISGMAHFIQDCLTPPVVI